MTDIVFLILTIGFFALCAALVRACDGIIGDDTDLPDANTSEVEEVAA